MAWRGTAIGDFDALEGHCNWWLGETLMPWRGTAIGGLEILMPWRGTAIGGLETL